MYIQCAYKNALRDREFESYAVGKLRSRVEQLVDKPVGIHVKFETEPGRETTTNCRVIAGDGLSVVARHTAGSFQEAIDGLVDKIAEQLRRKKAKHRGRKAARSTDQRVSFEALLDDDWDQPIFDRAVH